MRRSTGWRARSTRPSSSARAAMPASWPRSAAPRVSATAISTPASSTAISRDSAPPRRTSTAPPPRSARRQLVERESARIGASLAREPDEPPSPWDSGDAFQLSGARRLALPILADGESVVAQVVYGPRRRRSRDRRHRARDRRRGDRRRRRGLCAAPRPPDQGRLARSHPRRGWRSRAQRAGARAYARQGARAFWWSRASASRAANVSPSSRR